MARAKKSRSTNLDRLRKYRRERASGKYFSPPEGDSLIYVAPPARDEFDLPFVETAVHFGLGETVMCLNPDRNPLLADDEFRKLAEDNEIDLSGPCPICQVLNGPPGKPGLWDTDKDRAREIKCQPRFILTGALMWSRRDPSEDFKAITPFELKPWPCGKTAWESIVDIFLEEDADITDPDGAILVRVKRSGRGIESRYTFGVDTKTSKKPMRLGKPERATIRAALKPGSDCDPYLTLVGWVKPADELRALLDGVDLDDDEDDGDDGGSKDRGRSSRSSGRSRRRDPDPEPEDEDDDETEAEADRPDLECFGVDYDDEDEDCHACEHKSACAKECGEEDPAASSDDADDDDADDGDDELDALEDALTERGGGKKKGKGKAAKKGGKSKGRTRSRPR